MKLFVYIALTALVSCVLSQTLKTFFNVLVRKGKFKIGSLVSDGSYPSSHTAFTSSVVTISWIYTAYNWGVNGAAELELWCSVILTVFLSIVIRDALGVRYTVQKLCDSVTKLAAQSGQDDAVKKFLDVKSGHKPHEVLAGAVLGIIVASISSIIYYGLYKYLPYAVIAFVVYIVVSVIIVKKSVKKTA